jgi:hypothetical protein
MKPISPFSCSSDIRATISGRIPGLERLNQVVWPISGSSHNEKKLYVDTRNQRISFRCYGQSAGQIKVFSGLSFETSQRLDQKELQALALLIQRSLGQAMPLLNCVTSRISLNKYVHGGFLFNQCAFLRRRAEKKPEILSMIRQTECSYAGSFVSQMVRFRQICNPLTERYGLLNPCGLVVAALGYPEGDKRLITESYNFQDEIVLTGSGKQEFNTERAQGEYVANFVEYRSDGNFLTKVNSQIEGTKDLGRFDFASQHLTLGTGPGSAAYNGLTSDLNKGTNSSHIKASEENLSSKFQRQAEIAEKIIGQ